MAIITKGSNLQKGSEVEFTLNITDLLAHASVSGDAYFSDQSNWNIVFLKYKSIPGLQNETVVFKNVDSGETSVANFKVSEKARDSFFIEYIRIIDKQDGYLSIKRSDLNVSDFDVHFGEQPVEFTGFNPAVSATDNEINLIDDMQSDILEIRKNIGKVGDIKQSLLNEAYFQELHGIGWVLMDGRDVTGSDFYRMTGNTSIPDARGQFLRGLDTSGVVDPDGVGRVAGDSQNDKTRMPRDAAFSTNTSGQHRHTFNNNTTAIGEAGSGKIASGGSSSTQSINGTIMNTAGTHSHVISGGGDAETRPKNIAVNMFIKINDIPFGVAPSGNSITSVSASSDSTGTFTFANNVITKTSPHSWDLALRSNQEASGDFSIEFTISEGYDGGFTAFGMSFGNISRPPSYGVFYDLNSDAITETDGVSYSASTILADYFSGEDDSWKFERVDGNLTLSLKRSGESSFSQIHDYGAVSETLYFQSELYHENSKIEIVSSSGFNN